VAAFVCTYVFSPAKTCAPFPVSTLVRQHLRVRTCHSGGSLRTGGGAAMRNYCRYIALPLRQRRGETVCNALAWAASTVRVLGGDDARARGAVAAVPVRLYLPASSGCRTLPAFYHTTLSLRRRETCCMRTLFRLHGAATRVRAHSSARMRVLAGTRPVQLRALPVHATCSAFVLVSQRRLLSFVPSTLYLTRRAFSSARIPSIFSRPFLATVAPAGFAVKPWVAGRRLAPHCFTPPRQAILAAGACSVPTGDAVYFWPGAARWAVSVERAVCGLTDHS